MDASVVLPDPSPRPGPRGRGVLRADGHAYDDLWWPLDAEHWRILQHHAPEVLRSCLDHLYDSATLTPRG